MASNVEFFTDMSGKHCWRVKDDSNNVLAVSMVGYSSKANAINSLLMTHTLLSLFVAEMAKKGAHAK